MNSAATTQRLLDLLQREQWDLLATHLAELHPADAAEFIESAPDEFHGRLFELLSEDDRPYVLAELETDTGSELLERLTDHEVSDIVEDMAPDDAADLLGELPDERSEKVLKLMEKAESDDVRKLLKFDAESAGGIMTTDVVAMLETQTVGEAIEAIAYLDTNEKFYYANIVDGTGRMVGFISIWQLLRERDRHRHLGELARRDFVAATVDMDQEEVARLMAHYDLNAVPVLDNGVLVGRITADDVLDVMEEEASEDLFKMAGSDDALLESESVLRSCALRLPWLLITLAGSALTSFILRLFHGYVAGAMALAAFVPAVLAMGGNTGIQSSTLIVRGLAVGSVRRHQVLAMLVREFLTGAFMGCICGLTMGLFANAVMGPMAAGMPHPAALGIVVAVALCSAMTFAAVFGAGVPLILDRFGIDPATASGPFITITNDISALLIYFAVTILMYAHIR